MATIADKLTTIAGIKTDIRTAINNKGGSLSSGSPFSAYSAAISSLPSGGGGGASSTDWSQIGYSGAPQVFQDDFSYAKTIYDNWDPTKTNLQYKFAGNTSLVYMPLVDTSRATSMQGMFYGCSNPTYVPLFDTSSVTDMSYMFKGCSSLTTVPAFNTSACTTMEGMFSGCISLTSVPALDTREVTNMDHMFYNCPSLKKITSLDMDKCTSFSNMLGGRGGLSNPRFMLLKGLGTPSGVTSYEDTYMSYCTDWGVNSTEIPDARQSLVDSLLTYSFDRATAGYATCTVKLSSNSYNQLTQQEIADIQAKGYTITT